jgi:nucleotide-binding universal stress UspA family protein
MTHDISAAAGLDRDTGISTRWRVIVVGVDGSPTSWDAFAWAAGAAARGDGRLVAVHVVPVGDPVAGFVSTGLEAMRNAIAQELQAEIERIALELGVRASFVLERGDVSRATIKVAKEQRADLVVVGRSAKRRHKIAGSLSQRLSQRHDAPVVVVVP